MTTMKNFAIASRVDVVKTYTEQKRIIDAEIAARTPKIYHRDSNVDIRGMSTSEALIAVLQESEAQADLGLRHLVEKMQQNNILKSAIRDAQAAMQAWQTGSGNKDALWTQIEKLADLGVDVTGLVNAFNAPYSEDKEKKAGFFKTLETELGKLEGNAKDLDSEFNFELTRRQQSLERIVKTMSDYSKSDHNISMGVISNMKA